MPEDTEKQELTKPLTLGFDNISRLVLIVIILSLVLGIGTGYILSQRPNSITKKLPIDQPPKTAEQDTRTFRDFAEGVIKAKPADEDGAYTEGTHFLEREGAVSVAVTSSVVDLSKYEGKKVKVHGETQKALKEGWLMDVGKVEEK